jgi:hypothetical protein
LRRAEKVGKRLLSYRRSRDAAELGKLLLAAIAHQRNRQDQAISWLRGAVDGFEQVEMPMHAAAARVQLGRLLKDDEGRAMEERGISWLRSQEVANLDCFIRTLAPGFREA